MSQRRQWRRSVVLGESGGVRRGGMRVDGGAEDERRRGHRPRQQLMKEQGAAMRSIQEKLKAGQVQAVAVGRRKAGQDLDGDA